MYECFDMWFVNKNISKNKKTLTFAHTHDMAETEADKLMGLFMW